MASLDVLIKLARYGVAVLVLVLMTATLFKYTGHPYIYFLFSVVSNALLYYGVRGNAIFFDSFIGLFFWLGFWLKSTVRICFTDGVFGDPVGHFNGSGAAFDQALLVASCGLSGLLVARYVRERFMFRYPKSSETPVQNGIVKLYTDYRSFVLIGFVALFLTVALTNAYFGIYQRGAIARTALPLGLNGIYKWLLLFGMASFAAVILKCELLAKKKISYLVVVLGLLESFVSNVSLLSRGMILNVSALAYGTYLSLKNDRIIPSLRFLVAIFLIFATLFLSSVLVVNYTRSHVPVYFGWSVWEEEGGHAGGGAGSGEGGSVREGVEMAKPLFLDRWVGMEGVMAVSSYPGTGWDLWREAWKEKYSENTMSFYDKNLITSPYEETDFTRHHYISLPGIVAFFFYPGSFLFLFGSMFFLGLFAASIEMSALKLCGNNLVL